MSPVPTPPSPTAPSTAPPAAGRRRLRRAVALAAVVCLAGLGACSKADTVSVGAGSGTTVGPAAAPKAGAEAVSSTVAPTSDGTGVPDVAAACALAPDAPTAVPGAEPGANPTGAADAPVSAPAGVVAPECPDTVVPPHPTPGNGPPTCVEGPATTTPFDRGGGNITCSSPGAPGEPGAPPMTTIPGDVPVPGIPPPLSPDATHGVLRGTTGGGSCPKSAEMCDAMYALQPATISVLPAGGGTPVTSVDSDGGFSVLLSPGTYLLKTTAKSGPRVCADQTVTITAGATTDTSIDCALPG